MPNENSYEVALQKSNAIREGLAKTPEKFTMLTGDRPTGRLHLGHYFGTLKGRVELQNMGAKTNVLIADYQVITDRDTTEHIQDNVYNMVMDYLACGIDPDKTMIYAHSAVPAANQLMLPFLSLVSEAELARNPTVKAEMEASGHELTGLLLTYPVHQACDILFCKGNVVPVGRDQLPHIELTRTIARRFNNRYGKVFPEVDALLSETPLLPGLDGRKMSKSYGNAINISMTAEETAKRIKKSQTDSERMITFDKENRPGVSALLTTAAGLCIAIPALFFLSCFQGKVRRVADALNKAGNAALLADGGPGIAVRAGAEPLQPGDIPRGGGTAEGASCPESPEPRGSAPEGREAPQCRDNAGEGLPDGGRSC